MRTLIYNLRQRIKTKAKNKELFAKEFSAFKQKGVTSPEGYKALLDLYCATNGKFNEKMHKELIASNPPKKVSTALTGLTGKTELSEFDTINKTLNKEGYCPFGTKINAELISKIYNYALKANTLTAPLYAKKTVYDPNNLVSEIYRFEQNDLVNNTDIQQLIMDPVLINIARNYLGCEPIFDFPAMWWSTTFLKEASGEAAQLYHFDLDRIKWLKIFVYLNDVTLENGPHRLIKGSHLPGAKPQALLDRGYVRIPDEDLVNHYAAENFVVVTGKAGSVFAEDTKCWHKGTPLISGHRLVLEFEYTSSMFGVNYPKFEIENASEEFKEFCANNNTYASNFKLKN
ncbi:MAG: phytanoyl-CoA dioxygenase family protein [Bacteroidetes bacterium]|nr:phytanoyl-CoA dioxygenase family protein [Bacteroidota bacterium]